MYTTTLKYSATLKQTNKQTSEQINKQKQQQNHPNPDPDSHSYFRFLFSLSHSDQLIQPPFILYLQQTINPFTAMVSLENDQYKCEI